MARCLVAGRRCAKVLELWLGREMKMCLWWRERQLLTVSNWLLAVDASNAHRACGLVTDGRAARPAPEDVGQQNCSCEMIVVGAWLGVGGGRRCCGTLP